MLEEIGGPKKITDLGLTTIALLICRHQEVYPGRRVTSERHTSAIPRLHGGKAPRKSAGVDNDASRRGHRLAEGDCLLRTYSIKFFMETVKNYP